MRESKSRNEWSALIYKVGLVADIQDGMNLAPLALPNRFDK